MSESSGWQLASESVAEASERYLMSTFGYAWTQALIQLAAPQEGDRVLDVACGTGPVARYIAPFVGSTGRVVGLDLNSGMLERARAMPTPEGISIEWREGNATALPGLAKRHHSGGAVRYVCGAQRSAEHDRL